MLVFNLKKKWFDKIKSGEKTHEYREVKKYWINRIKSLYLQCVVFDDETDEDSDFVIYDDLFCEFVCGYANKKDKDKRLKAKIKSIKRINGTYTDLKIDKPVFDIEFEVIK